MKPARHFWARLGLIALFAMLLFVLLTPQATIAQGPGGDRQATTEGQTSPELAPTTNANLVPFLAVTLKGGYVAHGVGLHNLSSGNIVVTDIPSGSTIYAAYLIWNVFAPAKLASHALGKIDGHSIVGTLAASTFASYNWGVSGEKSWTYRASVKPYITPLAHTYALTGFANGGSAGFTMGASLVVIYSKPNYPLTQIQVLSGAAASRYGGPVTLRLRVAGVNALAPTGYARTTFIGGDGTGGATATFNSKPLPTVTWSNADGSHWDTTTVNLTSMVDPGDLDFWFSAFHPYGAMWVGQVVSYSNGSQDTDGDGLKDGWELNGLRDPVTNAILLNLPAMGANMWHKDLYVEADYMIDNGGGNHLPGYNALLDIVNTFATAPVNNPDGFDGVSIHIDTGGAARGTVAGTYPDFDYGGGNQVPFQANLPSADPPSGCLYNWSQFQAIKNLNFDPNRLKVFHYMIFAHMLAPCNGSGSGMSRNGYTDALFIQGATDFIVSLGGWNGEGSDPEREGTFVHELGHNLGLRHGGNNHENFKPNYLSIMGYLYQTTGIWRDGSVHYDYSRNVVPVLNELALVEPAGLGPTAVNYGVIWYCPDGVNRMSSFFAGSNLDWNCDGDALDTVSRDLNFSGAKTILGNQNNWANVKFKGGGIIGSSLTASDVNALTPMVTRWTDELTYELNQKLHANWSGWQK